MRKLLLISAITICPLASAHAATYKCVDEGRVTYQATPCKGAGSAINVIPPDDAAGYVKGTETDPGTTAAKFDEQAKELVREQRLRDINYETQKLEAEIGGYQSAMQSELDTLQQRRDFWDKQLGGKTQAQNVADEMRSVTDKYQSMIKTAQDKLTELNKEKSGQSSQSENAGKPREE